MTQEALHQRRRRRTVDVIVAEDGHTLAAGDCSSNAGCGLVAIGETGRVGHQRFDGRIEKSDRVAHSNIAAGQNPRDDIRQPGGLRNRDRLVFAGQIQPRDPFLAGE